MYNHVTFMGRICNEPELKTTPNGTAVLTFRIATERGYQAKNGERTTDFFDIIAWKNTAEFIAKYFAKGKMRRVITRFERSKKNGCQTT